MKNIITALASLALCQTILAADTISTSGFSTCDSGDSTIHVQNLDISFDKGTSKITFDVSGTSDVEQNVTATLSIEAYGMSVYNNTFDPCDASTRVDQLCPVPAGQFGAKGEQTIPSEYISKIPSIAFSVPDLDGMAKMVLTGKGGETAACIQSSVTNGKTLELPAVQAVAAAIAAGALLLSAASAALAGNQPGASHSSPGFMEVMWWMQGMATDGMYSVNYPGIYRSWTKNFAFSTGLVSWGGMQTSIDNFRKSTGGNLTQSNYNYLKNATLRFPDGSTTETTGTFRRLALRSLDTLLPRLDGITTAINGTSSNSTSASHESELVTGIKAYTAQLTVPDTNAFMTILMVFAILLGIIVVGILLFKVILEGWALIGKFPKSLATFRKEYWRVMAQTVTSLVLLFYGIWVIYCIYQFRYGDSWAARALASVTLSLFTSLLLFYCWKIWTVAKKLKQMQGDTSALYENKETWKKYKIFYENYRKQYWWLFMPVIFYMFAKGCVLAGASGHGMIQSIGQLVIEILMLILLLWNRPYDRKSGNWINIFISVVRVLSVGCILVFVEEFGIAKTPQTITGVVLIVVQASLTGILALLIAINAIINCCKTNPHRKRRKAAEKMQSRDLEGDAFLMEMRSKNGVQEHSKHLSTSSLNYDEMRAQAQTNRQSRYSVHRDDSHDGLVPHSPPTMVKGPYQSVAQDPYHTPQQSFSDTRKPRIPSMNFSPPPGHPGRSY